MEIIAAEKAKIKARDICDVQKIVTKDLLADKKQWGDIRTIQVNIVDANSGKKIDNLPEPHFLKELMQDLLLWLEDQQENG